MVVTRLIFSTLKYSVMTILIISNEVCSTSCSLIWLVFEQNWDYSKTVIAFLKVREKCLFFAKGGGESSLYIVQYLTFNFIYKSQKEKSFYFVTIFNTL